MKIARSLGVRNTISPPRALRAGYGAGSAGPSFRVINGQWFAHAIVP
jgi:hypothetical protein